MDRYSFIRIYFLVSYFYFSFIFLFLTYIFSNVKVYSTLRENSSFSSVDSMFVGKAEGKKNLGFQSDSPRSSVISVASEETEGKSEKEKMERDDEKETAEKNENRKVENEGENDGQSQSSFEISVTVHTPNESNETANATVNLSGSNVSGAVVENSNASEVEDVRTTSEIHLRTVEDETTSGRTELEDMQTTSFMGGTEDTTANQAAEPLKTDSRVDVEIEAEEDVTRSAQLEKSVVVEIDVTDTHG